jgi:hypothetical protein
VNQPWQAQFRVRQIMDNFYKAEPDGLIGNEDCGQMSAWYVLSAAGFYPVTPGSPVYAIGSPLFPEISFKLENGKSFVIKAHGVSERNIYTQSASLNGRPYTKSFFTHGDLMAGGELVFEMGAQPNPTWGVGENDVPVSGIAGDGIVPVPVIYASGKTFKNRLQIDIQDISKGLNFYYTTNGSEPTPESRRFTKPFFIDRSSSVKAVAIDPSGKRSLVATARYHKIPYEWTIKLISKYSSQYPGGGDLALIDGIRGTTNWSGGAWQGYQGQDFVAVIDLGKIQNVSQLGAGFLQDVGSWIWMPSEVDFELSLDGVNFFPALSVPNDISDKDYKVRIKDFVKTLKPQPARYVRIRAQNYGKIPSWHASSSGDAWIFVDEIIID